LLCEAFESTREAPVIEAFQRLFRDRGLPVALASAFALEAMCVAHRQLEKSWRYYQAIEDVLSLTI
jgi:hypothetical protein